jgi:hypothetical protein
VQSLAEKKNRVSCLINHKEKEGKKEFYGKFRKTPKKSFKRKAFVEKVSKVSLEGD